MSGAGSRAPAGLDRETIVDAALVLMDEHGVDGVSMRRLAGSLNVSATALYWHIGSQEGLWSAVLEKVLGRIVVEDDVSLPWQERVRYFLREARRQLLSHPSSLELSLRVGPPVFGRWQAITYDMMVAAGFRGQEAVDYARLLAWQATAYPRVERNAEAAPYVELMIDAETGEVRKHVPVGTSAGADTLEAAGYDPTAHYERMIGVFVAGLAVITSGHADRDR